MSELIAEARVLVTPDTTTFRSLLLAQTAAITKSLPPVPVAITPVVTGTTATAGLVAQQAKLAAATSNTTKEIQGSTAAMNSAAAATTAHTRRLGGLTSGAASAGLSLVGLRGATLAATGPFLAGAAGAIALGKGLQLATSFNSEIAVLGATTGATGEQLEQAAAAAREFGRDITLPGVTAGDAAKTITEFAKAGLSLNDSIDATRGGLQLAQAAQLSYEDAVTLTANALNAFNLSGNEAVRVADTLANASNLAQGGIGDAALALRQAAAAAAQVGVTFEDTTALITLLARQGLTGSDAGTALRTSFLRLVNPSKKAKDVLRELNIQLRDANGNVRPEVFTEFAAAQAGVSRATQDMNAAIVFGQDSFRAFGAFAREGTEGLAEVRVGLDETGTAARIAAARMTGLAGAQENLSNQLSDLGLTIGEKVTPLVTDLVDGIAELAQATNIAITEIEGLGKALDELPGAGVDRDLLEGLTTGLREGIGFLSPAAGSILDIRDAIKDGADETEDTAAQAGADLRSAIEDAGRQGARGARSFGDIFVKGIDEAFAVVNAALREKAREFRAAQIAAVGRAQGQAAGLDEAFNAIIAGGGTPQEQIANLQKQAQVQAKIIREAGPNAAGVQLEARRAARAELARINSQIVSIEAGIAADQRASQDEAGRIADDARRERDRVFLERQQEARSGQQRQVGLTDETESLQDDIRERQELRTLITQQIAALRASAVDERLKQAAIRELVREKQATSDEINNLVRAQTRQRKEQRDANRQEILDQRAENASLRTQIAEARGADESVIVKFIDHEIAIAKAALDRAKKAGQGILAAQLELERFREKKRELLKEAEDEANEGQGTTAFDLLTQAAGRFTGGNLIGINQPFAGPTEFTADLSQFLRRQQTTTTTAPARTTTNQFSGFTGGVDRLVTALDRNTNALTGGEAGPPKRRGTRPPVSGAIDRNDRRWRDSAQARETIEGAG